MYIDPEIIKAWKQRHVAAEVEREVCRRVALFKAQDDVLAFSLMRQKAKVEIASRKQRAVAELALAEAEFLIASDLRTRAFLAKQSGVKRRGVLPVNGV